MFKLFLETLRPALNGAEVTDASVERQVFTLNALVGLVGATAWVALYAGFGEPLAALIPGVYSMVTAITLPIAMRAASFSWFRDLQLLMMLVLPFSLMVVLGGFVPGSAVIIWGLGAPLNATLSTKPQRALYWFVAYGILLVLTLPVNPSSRSKVIFRRPFAMPSLLETCWCRQGSCSF